jgi:hypothetical protein
LTASDTADWSANLRDLLESSVDGLGGHRHYRLLVPYGIMDSKQRWPAAKRRRRFGPGGDCCRGGVTVDECNVGDNILVRAGPDDVFVNAAAKVLREHSRIASLPGGYKETILDDHCLSWIGTRCWSQWSGTPRKMLEVSYDSGGDYD